MREHVGDLIRAIDEDPQRANAASQFSFLGESAPILRAALEVSARADDAFLATPPEDCETAKIEDAKRHRARKRQLMDELFKGADHRAALVTCGVIPRYRFIYAGREVSEASARDLMGERAFNAEMQRLAMCDVGFAATNSEIPELSWAITKLEP